jgi:hypothetical protein
MTGERLRAIHDLERAIRVWEQGRDIVRKELNEKIECCEEPDEYIGSHPTVVKARSYIAASTRLILAAEARIEELERED